jgi:uncharacterized membrane protein YtjA (UPF0391 family)
MLVWAIIFFLAALTAALLGFTEIAGTALMMGQVLFPVFLILCVIFFVMAIFVNRRLL